MTFLLNLLIGFSTILVVSAVENTSLANTFTWVLNGATGSPTGNPAGCCDSKNGVNDCPPGSVPCSPTSQVSTPTSTTPGSVVSNNFSFLT